MFRAREPENLWMTVYAPVFASLSPRARASRAVAGRHLAQEDVEDLGEQGRVPGQSIAKRVRQTQHPLAHRHVRHDLVDQARRPLGHPPPSARGADAATLATEGHEDVVLARRAAATGKAMRQDSAPQIAPQLRLDKRREARAAGVLVDPLEECLQVLTQDQVQRPVLRATTAVASRKEGRARHTALAALQRPHREGVGGDQVVDSDHVADSQQRGRVFGSVLVGVRDRTTARDVVVPIFVHVSGGPDPRPDPIPEHRPFIQRTPATIAGRDEPPQLLEYPEITGRSA